MPPLRPPAAVSVITPFYEGDRHYLEYALASLLTQDFEDWEWIISEDGPTESGRELEKLDPRIRWLNSPRPGGPSMARNLAAAASQAPLLRNFDADDTLPHEETLGQTVSVFRGNPEIDYLVGPAVDVAPDGTLTRVDEVLSPGPIPPGLLYRYWEDNSQIGAAHPTTLTFRREAFFRVGGYPALPASADTAFLFLLEREHLGWFADFDVTHYAKREGSITATQWYSQEEGKVAREEFVREVGKVGSVPRLHRRE